MPKPIAEILADAREYLEKHGWTGGQIRENRRVCSVGAIVYSQRWWRDLEDGKPVKHHAEVDAVCQSLAQAGGLKKSDYDVDHIDTVINWNDGSVENKQEVLDLFAKAEKIQRAGFDPDA